MQDENMEPRNESGEQLPGDYPGATDTPAANGARVFASPEGEPGLDRAQGGPISEEFSPERDAQMPVSGAAGTGRDDVPEPELNLAAGGPVSEEYTPFGREGSSLPEEGQALAAGPQRSTAYGLPQTSSLGNPAGGVSDDDRLMSALAWVSMVILQIPVVSLVLLLSSNNKDRAFQRHHAITSILFWVAAFFYEILAGIAFTLLTIVSFGILALCLWVIFLLPHGLALYYALRAYQGHEVKIPIISDLVRKEGWG